MIVSNFNIASSASMNTPIASSAISMYQRWGYGIQASYSPVPVNSTTGVPYGTFALQVSNDNLSPTQISAGLTPTTWSPLPGSTAVVSGTSGTQIWQSQFFNYRWLQLTWVPSSSASSGILTATVNTNGIQ